MEDAALAKRQRVIVVNSPANSVICLAISYNASCHCQISKVLNPSTNLNWMVKHVQILGAKTGAVLGFKTSGPEHTMAQAAAQGLVQTVQTLGGRPETIRSDSLPLVQAIQPLAAALQAKIVHVKALPMAAEARQALEEFSSLS